MSKALRAAVIGLGVVCLASLVAVVLRPAPASPPSPPPCAAPSDLPGGGQGPDATGPHQGAGSGPAAGNAGETGSSDRASLLGGPGITVEQGRFVGRSGGERRWELSADQVLVREGETRVVVEGIRDGVLYDGGEPWLRFSAARGEADTATNSLVLEGVRFSSKEGDVLTARKLTWSEKDRKVMIEGNIRVQRGEGSVLLCEKAEYRPGDNVLEAIGRTTVEIELSDGETD
ncbi:MAG: hypothetical protein ACM3X3_08635 [Betaproteobacteria bacterium]